MEGQSRYKFLEDNPAVEQRGWLPPADEVPELGDLRADHDRLLDAVAETARESGDLQRKRRAELEAQRAAHEAAFLGQTTEPVPALTVTEDELAQATARADAARDALQTFAQTAIEACAERESVLLDQLDETVREAEAKRAEAERIMAEAAAMEASTRRTRQWLGRATGRSPLGQFPYEQMEAPEPEGDAGNVTVAELYAAQNPPIGFTEVLDDRDGAFGTDDPANLDPDARPWEHQLSQEALR